MSEAVAAGKGANQANLPKEFWMTLAGTVGIAIFSLFNWMSLTENQVGFNLFNLWGKLGDANLRGSLYGAQGLREFDHARNFLLALLIVLLISLVLQIVSLIMYKSKQRALIAYWGFGLSVASSALFTLSFNQANRAGLTIFPFLTFALAVISMLLFVKFPIAITHSERQGFKRNLKYIKNYWQLYVMLIIPLIYFIFFKYTPMGGTIIAFRGYTPGGSLFGKEWSGLRYFRQFLTEPAFWRAFRNTLTISITNLVINFPVPIIFALLLNELTKLKFKKFVQTVSYMPRFISTVVVISMLGEILSPSGGIINRLLVEWGFIESGEVIMALPEYFFPVYVLTDMWQFTGWNAIFYLSAITAVNSELFEAAMIDGANKIQQIIYVTIPSIMSTIMVMFILSVGRLLSLGFEKVWLLRTDRNPMVADIIDTFVYRFSMGAINSNYSMATAVGLFGGIAGVILVTSANWLSNKLTGDGVY